MAAQASTMSESAFETQDSKSHVTEVSELSESAGTTTGTTTPRNSQQDPQYFAVTIGRKPGIYTYPREYAEQIKGYDNAKSEKFNTRAQAVTYIEEQEESNISPIQLVPVLESVKDGGTAMIQEKENEFDNMSFDAMN